MIDFMIDEMTHASSDAYDAAMTEAIKPPAFGVESMINFCYEESSASSPFLRHLQLGSFVSILNESLTSKASRILEIRKELWNVFKWDKEYYDAEHSSPRIIVVADVLTFISPRIPYGIHLRSANSDNAKLVVFNIVTPGSIASSTMLTAEGEKFAKHGYDLICLNSILHEFAGHDRGRKFEIGTEARNMITNQKLTPDETFKAEETYESRFGDCYNTIDELRANAIALLLALEGQAAKLFCPDVPEVEKLSIILAVEEGLGSVMLHEPDSDVKWPDYGSQARFALLSKLMADLPNFVKLNDDCRFELADDLLPLVLDALVVFVRQLQTIMSTGNVNAANKLLDELSFVSPTLRAWRDTAEEKVVWPLESVKIQPSICLAEDGELTLKKFSGNHEGFVQSIADKYRDIYHPKTILQQWLKDVRGFTNYTS